MIKIIRDGPVLTTPFLDISARSCREAKRGLLGLAFHPLIRARTASSMSLHRANDGTVVVSEFLVSAASADLADAATERQVLTVTHPLANHNGGHMAFGAEGYLYIASATAAVVAIRTTTPEPELPARQTAPHRRQTWRPNFGVPPGNPFVGQAGKLPEIWRTDCAIRGGSASTARRRPAHRRMSAKARARRSIRAGRRCGRAKLRLAHVGGHFVLQRAVPMRTGRMFPDHRVWATTQAADSRSSAAMSSAGRESQCASV